MNCRNAQPMLSEYIDNALSARDTWELDKHLAECHECTRALNEMRRTVELMADASRFEVSNDFMARLQSRLDTLEPAAPRRAWLPGVSDLFQPRVRPLWGAAAASCALAAIVVFSPLSQPPSVSSRAPVTAALQTARSQSVGLAASNPLEDLSAANLVARSQNDTGAEGETAE